MALAAGTVSAGWESWLRPGIYGASFGSYTAGETLTDKGAVNGTWGNPPVPSGATAEAVVESSRTYMKCSLPGSEGGLVFRPDSTGSREQKAVLSSMWVAGYTELPALGDDVRAAFSIYAPEGGERSFVGWGWSEAQGACCWQELRSDSASPEKDGWRLVSIRFKRDDAGTVYVQYRLATDAAGEQYEPLRLKGSGSTWLVAGGRGSSILGTVEFAGEGAFENLDGSEPQRGLTAGVGNWRETLYDETVFRHDTGSWSDNPEVRGDDYAIVESDVGVLNTFRPAAIPPSGCTVAKFLIRFDGPYEGDTAPSDTCASVRMIEEADDVFRFVCLVDGAWVTNRTYAASAEAKYTVEVRLDRNNRHVSYQVHEGYGAEGGTNVFLCAGKMNSDASGLVRAVDFYGSGFVREIKGQSGK